MNKAIIIQYIKRNKGAEVAVLQNEFGIGYKEAKDVIVELMSQGELTYAGGVRYDYQKKQAPESKLQTLQDKFDQLHARLSEIKLPEDEDEEETDDDDDEDHFPFGHFIQTDEVEEEELRLRALELCIERQMASSSLLQRALRIGYMKASDLLIWMQDRGYVSEPAGKWGRREILIGEEEFKRRVNKGELDKKYAAPAAEQPKDAVPPGREHVAFLYEHFTKRMKEENIQPFLTGIPSHDSWVDEDLFIEVVISSIEKLMRSNPKMGLRGAVKKAETYLEALKQSEDFKMMQVYERLVFELQNTSEHVYTQLKKRLLESE